ncbi:MAG: hypothetical protein ACFHX7_25335 [Pseudomonadota bacterium]
MRTVILLLVMVLSGCAALKEGRTTDSTATANNRSDVVCVKEASVGSRIGTRVCRTARQIEQEEEAARRTLDQMRSGANAPGDSP